MELALNQRLYKISTDGYHFYTGHLDNGTQVLAGIQQPELVIVEFNAEGEYLLTTTEGLDEGEPSANDLPTRLREWQAKVGCVSSLIQVKQFFLEGRWIGIKDLPEHYQEVLDKPEDFDEERRLQLQDDIHRWYECKNFVLYWDDDYYFNEDGELESS